MVSHLPSPSTAPTEPREPLRPSAVATCARSLRAAIVRGELPPGLRLPPERELAERFSVNRATLRSALAQLETEKLLSVRQGSGYTVRDYTRSAGPDLIATLAHLAETASDQRAIVRDLLAVRRALAALVLERLVDEADGAALDEVDAAIDRFREAASRGAPPSELARADIDVVAALVAATKSPVLSLCVNPVASLLGRLPRLEEAMYGDPASNVEAFRAVVAWLRAGRPEGLASIMSALEARDGRTLAALGAPPPGATRRTTTPKKRRAR